MGPYIEYFECKANICGVQSDCRSASEVYRTIWAKMDMQMLRSLVINPHELHLASLEQFRNDVFEQLEELVFFKYEFERHGFLDFNFKKLCPALKTLRLGQGITVDNHEAKLPNTLENLDMSYSRDDNSEKTMITLLKLNPKLAQITLREFAWRFTPNWIIQFMIDCSLHISLKSFIYENKEQLFDTDGERVLPILHLYSLTPSLTRFKKLEVLDMTFNGDVCRPKYQQNVFLFKKLRKLNYLRVPMCGVDKPQRKGFLKKLAENVPISLKEFVIDGIDEDDFSPVGWRVFIRSMPKSCKCEKFVHRPYSPDLALYDYPNRKLREHYKSKY